MPRQEKSVSCGQGCGGRDKVFRHTRRRDPGRELMSDQQVLSDMAQGIATITLNRPAALNALTPQMMEGLIDATARAERDEAIRCVVIRGAGEHFMAGGDVKSFHKSLIEDRENYLRRRERQVVAAHQLIYQLRRMPKPVLACVQGAAAGFGLSLVLA